VGEPSSSRSWAPTLLVFVLLSISILVFRALHQNLTGDEASTYTRWVEPAVPAFWAADTNNHVLNSILMRISTGLLGGSPVAIRLPALTGGIVFCLLAGALAHELHGRSLRSPLVYVLLVFDPFVVDYLFAARGYSMAMAGQMLVLLCARRQLGEPWAFGSADARRRLMVVSTAAGVTSISSYAFLPGAVASLAVYGLCAVARPARAAGGLAWSGLARSTLFLVLPFVAIVGLVCGHNLWTFDMDSLTWGTYSLAEMFHSIGERVFVPPSPFVTPPALLPALELVAAHGPVAILVLAAVCVSLLAVERRRTARVATVSADPDRAPANTRFTAFCALVVVVTITGFLGMLILLKVRFPFGRTALVLVAPLTLVASGACLTEGRGAWARVRLAMGSAALTVAALGFFAALRFESFTEWNYDADVREAVDVAGRYMRARGLRRIGISWHYKSTGNYYRTYLGFDFEPLENDLLEDLTDGYDVYFIEPAHTAFIDSRKLSVLFEGPISGMLVAVRNPDSLPPASTSPSYPVPPHRPSGTP